MAKKYCFSCAYWNREEANFCENCGAKLPIRESVSLQPQIQAGAKKWKLVSSVSIVIIGILASSLLYNYSNYNLLSYDYNHLNYQYNILQDKYTKLNSSYTLVLKANQDLEGRIWYLMDEGISLNLTYHSYMLRYTDEMAKYVNESLTRFTSGFPPRAFGDDIGLDLYLIHVHWSSAFQNTNNYSEESIGRVHGWFYRDTLPIGQTYLYHADLFIEREGVSTAPLIFKEKRGVCYHFARVLVALYDCYFDMIKKPYKAYCIDMLYPSGNEGHECVLIKDNQGKVAIIDWSLITSKKVTYHGVAPFNFTAIIPCVSFTSIEEAIRLHEQYWKMDLKYTTEYSRDSYVIFKTEDEFFAWTRG